MTSPLRARSSSAYGTTMAPAHEWYDNVIAGDIEEIRESEEHNYRTSKKLLGDTVSLVDDLTDLYQVLSEIATKSPLAARDEYVMALHFLSACRYRLTIGSLAALRGHITDALRDCRLAIEACGFAAHIKRNPALARDWLDAGTSDAAYVAYRKKFGSGKKLFPSGLRQFQVLANRYDLTSKLGHPSIYKMAAHTKYKRTATALEIHFHYFEVRPDDLSEPPRTFLFVIDTHFRLLRVFEDVLAKAIAHDRARWDLRITTIDAKLDGHKEKWRRVCARAPRPSRNLVIIPEPL